MTLRKESKEDRSKESFIKFTLEKRVDIFGYVSWLINREVPGEKMIRKLMPGVTHEEDCPPFCFNGETPGTVRLFFGEFFMRVEPICMRANDTPVFIAKALYRMIKKVRKWTEQCGKTGGIIEVEEVITGEGDFAIKVTVNNEYAQTDW